MLQLDGFSYLYWVTQGFQPVAQNISLFQGKKTYIKQKASCLIGLDKFFHLTNECFSVLEKRNIGPSEVHMLSLCFAGRTQRPLYTIQAWNSVQDLSHIV